MMTQATASALHSPSTPLQSGFFQRNALLMVGVGALVAFWMLVYTFVAFQPHYASKAVVIIKDSAITSRYVEPDQYYALQTTSSSSSNPVLNTMEILKSDAIGNALWRYFSTQRPAELKKRRIKTQAQWTRFYQDGSGFLKAKNQPGTDLITIQFVWGDPVIAEEALEVVVTAFQEASRDLNKAEQVSRTKFLAQQMTELEARLADVRRQKSAYQTSQKTVSVRREGDDLAGSRMELSNKLSQLEAQARGKENLARRYQQMLGLSSTQALKATALGQNSTMARLQDELYRLQQQKSLLGASLTDTNPKVLEVQAQIEQVQSNIDAEKARTLGEKELSADEKGAVVADGTRNTLITSMLQAQGESQDLRAQAAVIRGRLGQINQDIQGFPSLAEGLASIEQQEASLSLALDHLRQKVIEGKMKEAQTLSNVFVVDAPHLPEKPQAPTRNHLLVLSVLMGLGSGLAVGWIREQLTSGRAVGQALPAWLEPMELADPLATPPEIRDECVTLVKPSGQPASVRKIIPQEADEVGHASASSEIPLVLSAEPVMDSHPRESAPVPAPAAEVNSERPIRVAVAKLSDEALAPPSVHEPETFFVPVSALDDLIPTHGERVVGFSGENTVLNAQTEPVTSDIQIEPEMNEQAIELKPESLEDDALELLSSSPVIEGTPQTTAWHPDLDSTLLTVAPLTEDEDLFHFDLPAETLPPEAEEIPSVTSSIVSERRGLPSGVTFSSAESLVQPADVVEAPVRNQLEPMSTLDETALPPASEAYEAGAKAMPLPRKRRGLPAFLLGEQSVDVLDAEAMPSYTLISKKTAFQSAENLADTVLADSMVSPVTVASLPSVAAVVDPGLASAFEEFRPAGTEPSVTYGLDISGNAQWPNALPSITESPDAIWKQPVKSTRWFSKKPERQPGAFFGLQSRATKQTSLPSSLHRTMANLTRSGSVQS